MIVALPCYQLRSTRWYSYLSIARRQRARFADDHYPSIQLGREFAAFTDDTEESILGGTQHQGAIAGLHNSLNACRKNRALPWCVGNQLRMVIPRLGRALSLSPDLLVHPTLGNAHREALDVAVEGPRMLVIEIASPSTAKDRDLAEGSLRGKPAAYAAIGIPEYLVFDPTRVYIPTGLWARKLGADGQYHLWEPEANGRWHSDLGIAFQPDPHAPLLRVFDQAGVRVPTHEELYDHTTQLADRNAELEAELRRLRGE